jgi:alpha-tubulin suppressor-like RCC1 family protein
VPVKAQIEGVTAVSAGMDFTMWLCSGRVWSAGYPQYGQLGDGSDHMFNASDSECRARRGAGLGMRVGEVCE